MQTRVFPEISEISRRRERRKKGVEKCRWEPWMDRVGWQKIDLQRVNFVIDPAYDSYDPQVRMAGGTPVHYAMEVSQPTQSSSDFKIDISKLRAKCTKKTKMIVLNNPNNPTGKLYSREELEAIAEMVRDFNLIVVADEVYEWHRIHQNCVFTCSTPTQEALATAFEKE
ncbi:prevent-host-death family protein [Teladorsagia circumcincta]|uniref:kynurenine--oxoglutarate transaminase n=1 Tax=Teladorsagia circumcincta TaxID=45464 RepID=A0A2G9TP26_TELCI|nr:prevent-host-death family protein [Teladorsagia circumcincta]